ncbi:MAG TPA: tripartite tricarboxylate transporter substrate binding protein [Burkholderiales bacterium]|nr:tripartite tricarboxylate transporter substrate binding protein [Burkholderiales bacterium]
MMSLKHLITRAAAFAFAASFASAAAAQSSYPTQPVRLMVGYAAGGANDSVARVLAPHLSEALGQPVVVENKLGAAGMIAAEHVAKAEPDGHTLLFAASSMFTTNPVMFKKVPYELENFAPITTTVTFPFFVVVGADKPFRSLKELAAHMKTNPKTANNAGAAGVHHLAFELFKAQTGAPGEFVRYKGTNQSVAAVMSGEVLMTIADAGGVAGALEGGRVRALAVTAAKRAAAFPEVPTSAEAGYPKLQVESWMGVLAPAGTPAAIVKRLHDEVQRIVKSAAFQERMKGLKVDPHTSSPDEFARMIRTGLADWRAVAKAAGIQPN